MIATWLSLAVGKRDRTRFLRAENLISQGKHAEALVILLKCRPIQGNRDILYSKISSCFLALGQAASSVAYFETQLSGGGRCEAIYLGLADAYEALGDTWSRFESLTEALRLNSNSLAGKSLSVLCGTRMEFQKVIRVLDAHFDGEFYIKTYNDIRDAKVNPVAHYALWGWRESRRPRADFDPIAFSDEFGHLINSKDIPFIEYNINIDKYSNASKLNHDSSWFKMIPPSKIQWDDVRPAFRMAQSNATVIIPVYKGLDETINAIFSVLNARGAAHYDLLVINDNSPDPELSSYLEKIAGLQLFEYVVNIENLGFVETCNKAISLTPPSHDIILFNSDAFVFDNWFSRIIRHADADKSVATITPLSNNATICSYPIINAENTQELEISPAEIDIIASAANDGLSVETPTGVGFCFFMRRSVIDEIGLLDSDAFKLGYGEECDFCMRALNAGYKNIIASDIFAYHVGSVSFSTTKEHNFNRGQAALAQKHPNYFPLVDMHVQADPLAPARRRIDIARIAAFARRGVLFITHQWGGGIETYIRSKQEELDLSLTRYVIIRVHDKSLASIVVPRKFGLSAPNCSRMEIKFNIDLLKDFILKMDPSDISVNSFAGLNWDSHSKMVNIIKDSNKPYSYVCHDYSCISAFYHLTRPDGIYSGIPSIPDQEAWMTMNFDLIDNGTPTERAELYSPFLLGAREVISPSNAASEILKQYHPRLDVSIVPHHLDILEGESELRSERTENLHIACIGAIGVHKGSIILQSIAHSAISRNAPITLSVIGYTDRDQALKDLNVNVTGAYSSDEDVFEHISMLRPDFIFIPSIWPETFCYTLSFAFKAGIPLAVFDLGAQSERAERMPGSLIIEPRHINAPSRIIDLFLNHETRARK